MNNPSSTRPSKATTAGSVGSNQKDPTLGQRPGPPSSSNLRRYHPPPRRSRSRSRRRPPLSPINLVVLDFAVLRREGGRERERERAFSLTVENNTGNGGPLAVLCLRVAPAPTFLRRVPSPKRLAHARENKSSCGMRELLRSVPSFPWLEGLETNPLLLEQEERGSWSRGRKDRRFSKSYLPLWVLLSVCYTI